MSAARNGKVEAVTASTHEFDEMYDPFRPIAYRFFASLFLYPDERRLESLQTAARGMLAEDFWKGFACSVSFEELLVRLVGLVEYCTVVNEYNRLFLIRPMAPPHETFYLDPQGQFRGVMISDLQKIYLDEGLDISPDLNELPDHISVELEFMAFLCMKALETIEIGSEDRANDYVDRQKTFLARHLARWFPHMVKRVKDAEPEHLYDAVTIAVFHFLRQESEWLGIQ